MTWLDVAVVDGLLVFVIALWALAVRGSLRSAWRGIHGTTNCRSSKLRE